VRPSSYREPQTPFVNFVQSIAQEIVNGVRRNKIAAFLAIVVLIGTTVFALNTPYDERPRYRQYLLPNIEEAEAKFLKCLADAENTTNEDWRVSYFMTAQARAQDVLNIAKHHWPHSHDAVHAHEELVRYYELILEDFAIIRTQMSLDDKMDFMAAWHKVQAERWLIHERWTNWVQTSVLSDANLK
jgi:hypothetical protein